MTTPEPGEVTRLLEAVQKGDAGAEEALCQVLLGEMRLLAERFLRRERRLRAQLEGPPDVA